MQIRNANGGRMRDSGSAGGRPLNHPILVELQAGGPMPYNFTRRGFAGVVAAGFTEFAFAQRANVAGPAPKDTVWLNANEFPEGHPPAVLQAIQRVVGETNRYHYREFDDFYKAVAASEKLDADQVFVGAGSTEPLHDVIEVFTSPTRPFITGWPTFEAMPELTAIKGNAVVKI